MELFPVQVDMFAHNGRNRMVAPPLNDFGPQFFMSLTGGKGPGLSNVVKERPGLHKT